jgi:UDPglucose 6-dehydrogenase
MTAVEIVVKEVAVNAKTGAILVEKSTVPCRTAKLVQDIVRYALTSSSHFLRTGIVISGLLLAR